MSWPTRSNNGLPLDSGESETSVRSLMTVLFTTKPGVYPLAGCPDSTRFTTSHDRVVMGVDLDEVYPNVFVGDMGSAKNRAYLQRLGVTHVLNTAEGRGFGMVDTSDDFYREVGIKYLGLPMLDLPSTNIAQHFQRATDFIHDGRIHGKVLVNCLMGMSRSSTCVLAFLMIREGMTAAEALRTVRLRRDIRPNDGFLSQLADLDNHLRYEKQAKL